MFGLRGQVVKVKVNVKVKVKVKVNKGLRFVVARCAFNGKRVRVWRKVIELDAFLGS